MSNEVELAVTAAIEFAASTHDVKDLSMFNQNKKVKTPKINNTQLLADTGLRIRHFHGPDRFGYPRMREMTVAYIEKRGRLEIATAVVHSQDRFCRKMGTLQAIENFQRGHTITVPAAQDLYADKPMKAAHPNVTLLQMFG